MMYSPGPITNKLPNGGIKTARPLKVLIVGCGLGGLACAIGCLREGLDVTILEKASELGEVGAGIQVTPNAVRVLDHYGLVPNLVKAGAIKVAKHSLLRYTDGEDIATRPGDAWLLKHFGHRWYVIHRADYHKMLSQEAERRGATIKLDSEVISVDSEGPSVLVASQERVYADVIIGADGLRSVVRDFVLGYHEEPTETGNLAYRATIPSERIEALQDPFLKESALRGWIGPRQHAVLYPVRKKTVFNLVLLCPDDLPTNVSTAVGNVNEMRELFRGWDPRLTALIAQVPSVLKWKICHMKELNTWYKDSVALLGDACHPSLPYQAKGAAMAVEDRAALGVLLGRLSRLDEDYRKARISAILGLYESMLKERTTINVEGTVETQVLYHMELGRNARRGIEPPRVLIGRMISRDLSMAGATWDI